MSVPLASSPPLGGARRARRGVAAAGRRGDLILRWLCMLAAALAAATMIAIAVQLFTGAHKAISHFGLGFLTNATWKPNFGQFGAGTLLFGTAVSSGMALLMATPIGIAIGLYLSTHASRQVRGVVGPLVEMLAAIPSVILGFWGILVLGPFLHQHLEPALHSVLGFLPIFGPSEATGSSVFAAALILTIMVVPIIASISRDLFLTVPRELQDAATALGSTRWEVVRGVVLPTTASGVVAAAFLGLGRALGEAIAVTQVIGAGNAIHGSLFKTGDTLASRIADQFQSADTSMHLSALFYLGVMLLVIGLVANLVAQWIARRFDAHRLLVR